jgi:hypothetical protein
MYIEGRRLDREEPPSREKKQRNIESARWAAQRLAVVLRGCGMWGRKPAGEKGQPRRGTLLMLCDPSSFRLISPESQVTV